MKTMKANFILGKKQIILASLVLVLGAAVYLNWQFAASNEDLTIANAEAETEDISLNNDILINGTQELLSDETGLPIDSALTGEQASGEADLVPTDALNEDAQTTAGEEQGDDATMNGEATSEEGGTKNFGDALFVNAKTISNEGYFAMASLARSKSRDEATQTLATILNDEKLTELDKKDVSEKALALTDLIEAESRIENLVKAKGFEECVVYLSPERANIVVKTPGLSQDSATQIKNIVVSECGVKGENIAITEIN